MSDFPNQQSSSGVWTQLDQYRAQAISNWPVASDPLFPYTSLLISGDGPNASDNNTFLDSGPNNFNVTRNGNVSQGGFSPFGEGWSNYFDGAGDYLQLSTNIALTVNTGDFTCEFWFYNTDTTWSKAMDLVEGPTNGFTIYTDATGILRVTKQNVSGVAKLLGTLTTTNAPLNTWNHFAIVRSSGISQAFINGISLSAGIADTNSYDSMHRIGGGADGFCKGYISNFRFIKGTALYTANFTPPTSPLTAITNTVLLTCQSNRFVDNSTNKFAITPVADVKTVKFSPFKTSLPYTPNPVGSSVYFDGLGDYLTLPSSQSSLYLTGAFTWEAWIYPTGATHWIYGNWANQVGQNAWSFVISPAGTFSTGFKVFWYRGNFGTNQCAIGSTTGLTLNRWNHFAITRDASNNIRMFIDGVQLTLSTYNESLTWDNSFSFTSTSAIGINGNATYPNSGPVYISNLRFIQGTALYTTSFTPPTQPLAAVSGTALLVGQTNKLIDSSTNNFTLTASGNVAVSELSPYTSSSFTYTPGVASSSVFFDGNGDLLSIGSSAAFNFSTIPVTIEFWMYPLALPGAGNDCRVLMSGANSNLSSVQVYFNSSGILGAGIPVGGTQGITTAANTIKLNTWQHIAVIINGATSAIYYNGNLAASGTITTPTSADTIFKIGFDTPETVNFNYHGYISNVRIVKSTAVYTAPFNPPTQPLTAIANTSLLTCLSKTLSDLSTNIHTIGVTGNAAVDNFSPYDPASPYGMTGAGGSVYFDGSGDYLTTPASANLFLSSTADWTVEGWVYPTTFATANCLFFNANGGNWSTTANLGFYISATSPGRLIVEYSNGTITAPNITGNVATIVNSWNHVAFVYNGTSKTLTTYVNGVVDLNAVSLSTYSPPLATPRVTLGRTDPTVPEITSYYMNGYLSNWRIVRGTRLYTTNFTPPTTPLTAIANTSLLTCRNNTSIVDLSTNNFTITSAGNAVANYFDPFRNNLEYNPVNVGGSMYFDGTGDYLSIPDSTGLELGSSNFTIETWVYLMGTNPANGANIISKSGTNSFGPIAIGFNPGGNLAFTGGNSSSTWSFNIPSSVTYTSLLGRWNHIALVRNGNAFNLYLNGNSVASTTFSGGLLNNTESVMVGYINFANTFYTGYISNLRMIIGTALYVGPFTPPTAPLKPISGTALLLEGTNAPVLDHTGRSNIETVGNAKVVTAQSKWGSSSLYFDGNGDYLTLPNSVTAFGTGNFTVECWINTTVIDSTNDTIISNYNTGSTNAMGLYINRGSNGGVQFYFGTTLVLNAATAISLTNTWYHIAVARSSGVSRLFINGVQAAQAVDTGNYVTDASLTYIGAATTNNVVGNYLNGYIDDLRVTTGVARYTSDFNPPGQFAKM